MPCLPVNLESPGDAGEDAPANLKIAVFDADCVPVSGVSVSVTPQFDAPEIELKTDGNGEVIFHGFAEGRIKVMVSASGMSTVGGFHQLEEINGTLVYQLQSK